MSVIVHLYYLDNHGESAWTNDWKYYRVTSIHNMHIETCEVEFPSLQDKGVPTQHPLIVGLASAYDIKGKHLASLGIDQEHAILIGIVAADQSGKVMK